MPRRRARPHLIAAVAFTALALWSCDQGPPTEPSARGGESHLYLSANLAGTNIVALVAEVTAADIPEPLIFNIPVEDGVGFGVLTIPAGSDRTITVRAFDASGIETHRGSTTVDVVEGDNPTVAITLFPLVGNVPVEVTIGSLVVNVEPGSSVRLVGRTLQLTATITDGEGNEVEGDVVWGSRLPLVAAVDQNGLVTAIGEGDADIVANFANVRGVASVEVITTAVLVASTGDNAIHVFDPATLRPAGEFRSSQMTGPLSVAGSSDGHVYAGTSARIIAFDLETGGAVTLGAGVLAGPIYGTTLGDDGLIYASGSAMPDVRVMAPDGASAGSISSPQGSNLRSSAFGPDGSFYLTSFAGGPVQRWSPGFVFRGAFGGGGLSSAFGVGTRSNGDVVVASQNGAAYFVFTSDGTFLRSVAVACTGQIRNIAVDDEDNVWVGCYGHNSVVRFDSTDSEVGRISVSTPSGVGFLNGV
jgi:hypothetical protein